MVGVSFVDKAIREIRWVLVLSNFLCFLILPCLAAADSVFIAAASSLKFAFEEIAKEFHRENLKTPVRLTFGSSGNHFGQIKNGAPFDIFFSADRGYPEELAKAGLGAQGESMVPYALGRLALWASKRSQLNPELNQIRVVLDSRVQKVSLANPRHAPYGRAAVEILRHYGLFQRIKSKLVMGENIAQAAQFTQSGAAQAGIVSLSMAIADSMKKTGVYWEVPPLTHKPVVQGLILLRNGRNLQGARRFAEFILSERGRSILNRWGFDSPGDER